MYALQSACASLIEHANLDSPLLLYNRTAKRASDLAASLPRETTKAVTSIPEGISQADIIFTCVSDDRAAEETYKAICRANGGSSAAKTLAGKVLVGMETVAPETANRIAQLVHASGGEYVACPVLGPPQAAAQGMLLAIPAGPAAAVEKIVPYLTGRKQSSNDTNNNNNNNGRGVLARALIGPFTDREAGTALKMKIIANTFTLNAAAQLAEAYTLGEKCGVGVDAVRQFVDINFVHGGASAAATNPFAVYSARMLGGAYFAPGDKAGAVGLGIKDAKHALEMAEEVGVMVRNPATVVYWAEKVVEYDGQGGGLEEGDIAGMYGAVRKEAGLSFENGP